MAAKTRGTKKSKVNVGAEGYVFIKTSFNNSIITFANATGDAISWSSAGKMGFRGSKKNTPYAAQQAATDAGQKAYDAGLRRVKVRIKGPGAGREAAIRAIGALGIDVSEITDITPAPHNGCRPSKQRRV